MKSTVAQNARFVACHCTASMLVIRTKHFRLGLTPARRSGHTILHVQLLLAQSAERELGMAWLWPERLDIEVPAAVCTAATMGALGRIPVETRIAPKSENWELSPHRRGVGDLCASSRRRFCTSPGRPRHAPTTRLGFVHGEGASPCRLVLRVIGSKPREKVETC